MFVGDDNGRNAVSFRGIFFRYLAGLLAHSAANAATPLATFVRGHIDQSWGDEAAAAGIAAALDPIEGVIGAETFVRSSTITQLVVTTVDVDTARRVQEILTAEPGLLQAYRSLQFTVPRTGGEGTSFPALSTAETGFVGSLEPAAELTATDGVSQSVLITPSKLELVMERDADPADIARAVKAVAVRGQEAEIFGSTLWGRNDERAAYEFEVGAKLRDDLVNGYGEKGPFVEAWNAAPMP
ncbi:hypothetical protein [Microbacterium sp. cx-59]|uniref:hypothetical protein n=1 Tax=Microbacterium sp. cx-59 TaxID=2891207 RepID=UPI001E5DB5E5|nr:hypothetical protein [Microbacterium sp. cx-59]MCC4908813.1 hypothetical protein [Microbacterium sp. cx-59]